MRICKQCITSCVKQEQTTSDFPALTLAGMVLGTGAGILTGVMYSLILTGDQRLDESGRAHIIDFVRLRREETSARKDRRPERPEVDEQPPAPETPQSDSNLADNALAVSDTVLPDGLGDGLGIGGLGFDNADGDYLPIVKIAPAYPMVARNRGIEGHCLVEYTVTPAGTVKDTFVSNVPS